MTPKEKAIDLLNKFGQKMYGDRHWLMIPSKSMQEDVKQFTLIAVNEIIKTLEPPCLTKFSYWQEVKNEIEKL